MLFSMVPTQALAEVRDEAIGFVAEGEVLEVDGESAPEAVAEPQAQIEAPAVEDPRAEGDETISVQKGLGLAITSQPVSVTLFDGQTAAFSVEATGSELTYQWQVCEAGGDTWVDATYDGSTSTTLAFVAAEGFSGSRFRCVVTDVDGDSVTSDEVVLTALPVTDVTTTGGFEATIELAGQSQWFRFVAPATATYYLESFGDDDTCARLCDAEGNELTSDDSSGASGNFSLCYDMSEGATYYYEVRYADPSSTGTISVSLSKSISIGDATAEVSSANGTSRSSRLRFVADATAAYAFRCKSNPDVYATSYQLYNWAGMQLYDSAGAIMYNEEEGDVEVAYGMTAGEVYYYDVTWADITQSSVSIDTVLRKVIPTSITSQPEDTRVTDGQVATFSVEATGRDLTYQWQVLEPWSDSWADASYDGSDTETLSLEATEALSGSYFRCVVNGADGDSVTSDEVILIVDAKLAIISQPESTFVTDGEIATFSVEAIGIDLTYQWQVLEPGEYSWTDASYDGSDTETLSLEATEALSDACFRCVVTNADGDSVTSDMATLTVCARVEIISQPSSTRVTDGQNAAFSIEATGTNLTYQWQVLEAGAESWASSGVGNPRAATMSFRATETLSGARFRCVVTDASGSSVTSEEATLEVDPRPTVTVPADHFIIAAEGQRVSVSVDATGEELTYQWQWMGGDSWYWTNIDTSDYHWANVDVADSTTDTLSFTSSHEVDDGYYCDLRCAVTDRNGCVVNSDVMRFISCPVASVTLGAFDASIEASSGYGEARAMLRFVAPTTSTYYLEPLGSKEIYIGVHSMDGSLIDNEVFGRKGSIRCSLVAGTTYYFDVRFQDGSSGTSSLSLSKEVSVGEVTAEVPEAVSRSRLRFAPEASGAYAFESSGPADTEAALYDSSGRMLVRYDDGGEGDNFGFSYHLTAGEAYYYDVWYADDTTGTINATLEAVEGDAGECEQVYSGTFKVHVDEAGASQKLLFVPPATGTYYFESMGAAGVAASLSDVRGNPLASDDGEGDALCLTCDLTAFNAYYLDVSYLNASRTGTVDVSISRSVEAGPVSAVIAQAGKLDRLRFVPPTSGMYELESTVFDDTRVILRDAVGDQLRWDYGDLYHNSTVAYVLDEENVYYYDLYYGYYSQMQTGTIAATLAESAPRITSQPADCQVAAGQRASFEVAATGSGLSYQWQTQVVGTDTWAKTNLGGSKRAKLSFVANDAQSGRRYRCVVTDRNGSVAYSEPATLTVDAEPTFVVQPESKRATQGQMVTFSVNATGSELTYQWQTQTVGSSSWVNTGFAGNTTNTLHVEATLARDGRKFRCEITDRNGCVAYSSSATLSVDARATISVQPTSVRVTAGQKASFTVTVDGSDVTYQWQTQTVGSTSWANTSLAGYATQTLSFATNTAQSGRKYRCKVTDRNGYVTYSSAATLTVDAKPVITEHPVSQTASTGQTITFSVTADGTNLTYQWQTQVVGSTSWSNTALSGATSDTLSVGATIARSGRKFRCKVTDGNGCSVYSSAATLIVEEAAAA